MRIKQLAAIVEPRPWWAPFIRVGTRLARVQLPMGATAILALTFLTVREYQQPELDSSLVAPMVATKVDTMPGPGVAVAHSPAPAVVETIATPAAPAAVRGMATKAEAKRDGHEQNPAVSPSQLAGMVPILGGAAQTDLSSFSPAARAIAANLAAMKDSAPELVQFVEHASGMNAIFNPPARAQVVDPLSRMQSPSESRRSARLLARALPAAQYAAGGLTDRASSDRLNRTLTEDRLYDSISRFGVNGNQVAIKF
ncbi:MAG: hypothetical protein ACHQ4G_06895 [Opitutales bacterium]